MSNNNESSSEDDFDNFMNKMEEESSRDVKQATERTNNSKAQRMEEESEDQVSYEQNKSDSDDDLNEYKDELAMIKKKKLDLLVVDHKKMNYYPIVKNVYVEVPEIKNLSPQQVLSIRKNDLEGCIVHGKKCPNPINNWYQCGLNEVELKIIKLMKFIKPTPVQCQAIPTLMSGLDAIVCAKTGSGKTLAYVLPMLKHVLTQPPLKQGEGPIAMVFVPQRELAEQIALEIKKFTKFLNLRTVAVFGGIDISGQIGLLKRGAEIVVCTPGRMIEILCTSNGNITNLHRVSFIVLDEADRMFDMGFGPQMKHIIDGIRPDRQTVMFSATFPKTVENHAKEFLSHPIEIICGGRNKVSDTVEQHVEVIKDENKLNRLKEIVKEKIKTGGRIIVFAETQNNCDTLYQTLMMNNIPCLLIHAGIDQIDRQNSIDEFKRGSGRTILISTSVCARGLDVKGLEMVINYDCPNHYEDYVHRVGRCGRAGEKGVSYTFITPEEDKYSDDLIKALTLSGGEVSNELLQLSESWKTKKLFLETDDKKKKTKKLNGYGGQGFKFDRREELSNMEKKMGAYKEEEIGGVTIGEKMEEKRLEEEVTTNQIPKEKQECVRKALEVIAKLNRRTARFIENKYQTEVMINDFSQQARQVLTNKDRLAGVTSECGVQIVTRGIYIAPGKPVPPGKTKLHLLIEGPSLDTIKQAQRMIKEMLKEITERYRERVAHEKIFTDII